MRQKPLENIEEILIEAFNLQRVRTSNTLSDWIDIANQKDSLTADEMQKLDYLRLRLLDNVNYWYEEDLKMKFLAQLFELTGYEDEKEYNTYFDKEIQATHQQYFLKVKADFMIAKGVGSLVRKPYFCFHEFKKDKKYNGDPVGQLLSAMVIAQSINQNQKPVYGVYIVGQIWFFVVLHHNTYCISNAYNATETDDLHAILLILRKLKTIIKETLLD
jgi:hypothetical protein